MIVSIPFWVQQSLHVLASRIISGILPFLPLTFVVAQLDHTSCPLRFDIIVLSQIYPLLWRVFINDLFTEIDGTTSLEWAEQKRALQSYSRLAAAAAALRCLLGFNAVGLRAATAAMDSSFTDAPTWRDRYCTCPSYILSPFLYLDSRLLQRWVQFCCSVTPTQKKAIRRNLQWLLSVALIVAISLVLTCLASAVLHFGQWPSAAQINNNIGCDPLDDTECWLPFPSFHALIADNSTVTGWRVNLQGELLPRLKSRAWIQPEFLNQLDGFSTMAPMLFYMKGLKEAHEAGIGQLKGSFHIAESMSELSATLLLDVTNASLVPHTAEIDYLDAKHPLVMLFPAQPLYHNRQYAVAVVNAKDSKGKHLAPTEGMRNLLLPNGNTTSFDTDRRRRYLEVVIPALRKAASWLDYTNNPESLQLLFDFHTVSEKSQLGPVRAVRDKTIAQISSPDWDWTQHVRVNQQIDYDCNVYGAILARTVHAELDVPWFLHRQGRGSRADVFDPNTLLCATPNKLGVSKFLVHIPCSVRASAVAGENNSDAKPLRAIIEYGHGLFGNRGEASDDHILRMAHNQGYIVTAMDWRGMSSYDLLVVAKVLISAPRLFQAVRDNLIQGYACKYAMQHFSRHTLLSMDWLAFKANESTDNAMPTSNRVPTLENKMPSFVFYGISQGGILGAGYVALSGVTGLIDRGILGSPGTPFALIMTRSLDFLNYDKLLLLDFFNNRQVRMLLTLVQMAWDSVEASGVLANPVNEPYPPVLIQAGLGDVIVSNVASVALGRAFNASLLPTNPREVFGIPTALAADSATSSSYYGPHVTMTEVMYDNEFYHLSEDNHIPESNWIHFCLRKDHAMISQISEFINTGRIIDPCTDDGCHRSVSWC